jgi:putative phosphoribosyl transferase
MAMPSAAPRLRYVSSIGALLTHPTLFADRRDAGRRLGERLEHLRSEDPVVLGLPRGGVPVAYEVASALEAPLDVLLVRKIGAPFHPEYGVGAIAEGGARVVDPRALAVLGIEHETLERIAAREQAELERRQRLYRGDGSPVSLAGRTAVLVDDGVATGGTATAAAHAARARGATKVVLAVPVGPPDAAERFAAVVDEFVCLEAPEGFFAVGAYYAQFGQTSDDEVRRLLAGARHDTRDGAATATVDDPPPALGGLDWSQLRRQEVEIPADSTLLPGDLRLPPSARGLVIFAHGSGSSRLSPRNIQVASALNAGGLATLLFDLLTDAEASARENVFDVTLLAGRLVAATHWAARAPDTGGLPVGYFGASTGAAAALCAAADLGSGIRAVVSRGGRPDLAGSRLGDVTAPTLLIVGGDDLAVQRLNEDAARSLRCPHELAVVPGATHLFEEPGALEEVARLAGAWLSQHLSGRGEAP